MPHFFIILLKINLVLVLFAAAYYLILRRLTFYVINRIFLAFGILFSTVYPFIDLTDFFSRQNQQVAAFVPKLNQRATDLVPSSFITDYWQWISIFFYVGVVLMAFRLVVQFVSLYRMHKKSTPGSVANYNVRILDEPVSPFSFWQTVYINPTLHKERELNTILAHENIHVKEWHSLDIILAELSVVFYWFNPGVWLMKKAVKENLEFITDEKILKRGMDKKAYQYSLLDVGSLTPSVAIVNNFNLSDLKKRIKMMNVKRSSRLTLSRYLFVLPVLLLTTLAFTVSKKDIKAHLKPLENVLNSTNIIAEAKPAAKKITHKSIAKKKVNTSANAVTTNDSASKFTYLINTIFIRTDSNHNSSLEDKFTAVGHAIATSVSDVLPGLKGRIEGKMLAYRTDTLTGVSVGNVNRVEGFKLVRRGEMLPTDADIKDKEVVITVKGYGSKSAKPTDSLPQAAAKINFVLNGKTISKEELSKIDPENIKTVDIKKVAATPKLTEVLVIGSKKKP